MTSHWLGFSWPRLDSCGFGFRLQVVPSFSSYVPHPPAEQPLNFSQQTHRRQRPILWAHSQTASIPISYYPKRVTRLGSKLRGRRVCSLHRIMEMEMKIFQQWSYLSHLRKSAPEVLWSYQHLRSVYCLPVSFLECTILWGITFHTPAKGFLFTLQLPYKLSG